MELLLFLNETGGLASREDWSHDPGAPELTDAARLEPIPEAAAGLIPFQSLAPGELELTEIFAKLQRSGHYRPLLHTGWRQPFPEGMEEFIPVHINAPLQPPPDPLLAPSPVSEGANPPTIGEADQTESQPVWSVDQVVEPKPVEGIEGTVRLRVARYLHFDVDLLYQKEQPLLPETAAAMEAANQPVEASTESLNTPAGSPGLPFFGGLMADFSGLPSTYYQKYRLTEQRRLRREEIHYFDHPKFGLLVKVTAYEPPPPEATTIVAPPPATAPQPLLPIPVPPTGKATTKPLR